MLEAHGVLMALAGLIVGLLCLLWWYIRRERHMPWQGLLQRQAALTEREVVLTERLTRLETRVDVFWFRAGRDAAATLHSPTTEGHARKDVLIEHFIEGRLTPDELREFEQFLLQTTMDRQAVEGHRLAAAIVLRALEAYGTAQR
jgi:hypothetical protein